MADLEELVSKGEGIKDKKLKLFGLRLSGTSIVAAFAFISTIVGTLYGGFLMYQKVEGIANLDLGAISSQMAKTSSDVIRIEEHANAIKIELKKDMIDLRNSQWSLESTVDTKLQSVDTKLTNYDTKLDRFEIKVEKTKEDINKRIQESLDNPLANQEKTMPSGPGTYGKKRGRPPVKKR